jgi:hypothetical protein
MDAEVGELVRIRNDVPARRVDIARTECPESVEKGR